MTVSLIRPADHRLRPWKNGQGVTREVALRPDGSGGFLWRISIATVDRPGPFSAFPGLRRIIMLLEGDGLRLVFAEHGEALLDRPFAPLAFEGDWQTSAELLGGPVRDLNVIFAHQRCEVAVEVLCPSGQASALAPTRDDTVFHVLRGGATVRIGERAWRMDAGDSLHAGPAGLPCGIVAGTDEAMVYRIDAVLR
jgi:environmental stress-induced protein Ves